MWPRQQSHRHLPAQSRGISIADGSRALENGKGFGFRSSFSSVRLVSNTALSLISYYFLGGFVRGFWALERTFFAALASSSFLAAPSVEAVFNASTCEVPLEEAALVVADALPMLKLPSVN